MEKYTKYGMQKIDIYRIITLVLVVICCIFCVLLYNYYNVPTQEPIIIKDTVTVTEFVDKLKYVNHYDTIITDTIVFNDTIYKEIKDTIKIPIEHKESSFELKKDSFELNGIIHYHGFKTDIDNIDFNYKFTYQPPVVKKRKFHISIQGGIGAQYGLIHNKVDIGPYVGCGFSYDIW